MQYTFINWVLFYIVFVPNSGPQNKVKYTETAHKPDKDVGGLCSLEAAWYKNFSY